LVRIASQFLIEGGNMRYGTNTCGSFVWNFEFGSLGFICILVFGAWNFLYSKTPQFLDIFFDFFKY